MADYLRHLPGGIHGSVAEVGPGDSCAVALLMVEQGAQFVDLVDRFYSIREDAKIQEIHRSIIRSSDFLSKKFGTSGKEESFRNIKRYYGPNAAAETFFGRGEVYDLIVSRAVLEHLQDVPKALSAMARSLKPGGRMVHLVDLRDHGMFTFYGFPELTFLEVPDALYRAMTDRCGHPNRVPMSVYRDVLAGSNLMFEVLVNRLVGEAVWQDPLPWNQLPLLRRRDALQLVRAVRPSIAKSLRPVADEDLAVAGFTIVASRPA
ncbi:methyltransferase domain-containing protein [Thermaurantiacus sp.]